MEYDFEKMDLEDIKLSENFPDTRKNEIIMLKITAKMKNIFAQYQAQMDIENKSGYIVRLIKADIIKNIENGFVEIK